MYWYIDLGANWANTLGLFESIKKGSNWNIVAFEASPLVQPFLRDYCDFLNGDRNDEPENCLPRSGSTRHLLKYAQKYNCSTSSQHAGRTCMWKCLSRHLDALSPDHNLNSSDYVHRALQHALIPTVQKNRYTFIPAAVSDRDGWTDIYESPRQLIRGGALPSNAKALQRKTIVAVDIAQWLLKLPVDAYVFMKMDIEGAEHKLVERMEYLGSYKRISHISIECHGRCKKTMRRIRSWNVTVVTENSHHGMDRRAIEHTHRPIMKRCQCS